MNNYIVRDIKNYLILQNKIDFLYPSSSTVSPQSSFTPVSISHELGGLNSFNTPQVTPISQVKPILLNNKFEFFT